MKKLICLFKMTCITGFAWAQCPISFTSTVSTPASCPSGGSISVLATGSGNTYRILSGPFGYAAAANSTGIFNSLKAGTYQIEANNGACSTSTSIVVADAYPIFVVNTGTTANICTSMVQGGTVTGTVNGGRAPYQYDIVPVATIPTYSANSSSTSFSKVVSSFGIYRFYAKDACGEVRTMDIIVQATQPKPTRLIWEDIDVDRPCNELMDGLPTVTWDLHLRDENGAEINDLNALVGTIAKIYKPAVANSINYSDDEGDCTKGALLNIDTIKAADLDASDPSHWGITIPTEDVILELTTPCGFTFTYCYNFNEGQPITPSATFRVIQKNCGTTWSNQTVDIKLTSLNYFTNPVKYELTKANGSKQNNTSGNFHNLTPADFPATVKVTDTCNKTLTKILNMPIQGTPLQATAEPNWDLTCTNIEGTSTANIIITGGDLPGIQNATNVTITGGTLTAVPTVSRYQRWMGGFYASNLLPCSTYTIRITNLCGEKDSVLFTVPCNSWGQDVLSYNLTATTQRLCGQNLSTIIAQANFSSDNPITYTLYEVSAPFAALRTNNHGTFNNVPPGTYKIKFLANTYNSSICPSILIGDSIIHTLLPDNVNQSIIRKLAYNCETGGITQPNGRSTIEVNGAPPFTYEIIKTNLIGTAGEAWTVSSTGNTSNVYTWNLPLAGDPANTNYTLRSTDKCGNKITTQASLQPLGAPVINVNGQPCLNQPNYSVYVNSYVGNFTYKWVKTTDPSTVLSTSNTLTFPGPYTAANNGTYQLTISDGGCVEKIATVNINSDWCAVLSSNDLQLNGYYEIDNNTTQLKWTINDIAQASTFKVLRSVNGVQFDEIANVTAIPGVLQYNFSDAVSSLSANILYYKIKLLNKNGSEKYSTIVKVSVEDKDMISVYPNPATTQININVTVPNTGTKTVKIYNQSGTAVVQSKQLLLKGENFFQINRLDKLSAGVYIIELAISDTKYIRTKFVKK